MRNDRISHEIAADGGAGSRPTVVRHNGRKSISVFGIVDPVTGWSMVSPHREANTTTMQQFLHAAAKNLGPRRHAVMVLDGAGWHTAKQFEWPRRILPGARGS